MAADPPARRPRILSRRLACTNSVWNVYFTHVSDGAAEVPDYLVLEPKARSEGGITGVAILPLVGGRIGLIAVDRIALNRVFDEIPKGFVEPGENLADAALRELSEETGLVCTDTDLVDLGVVALEPSTFAGRLRIFAALRCRAGGGERDAEVGLGELTFHSVDEVREMAENEELEDAATLVAIYRLLARSERDAMVRNAMMG